MRCSLACSVLVSLCALALAPRPAHATSCLPTVGSLLPNDGEPLPVSARPLAEGDCGIDLSGWEVDIDGEPGMLAYESFDFVGPFVALGIEPAPTEGAVVELRGCVEGCWQEVPEFDLLRTYTVGADDTTAPATPGLLELVHADEIITEYDFDPDQGVDVAVRRWTVRFEPPVLDEPVVWEVEVGPTGGTDPTATGRIMGLDPDVQLITITRYVADAGEEVCATARAHDLSGNASADAQICVQVAEDDLLPEVPGGGGSEGGSGDEAGSGSEGGSGDDGADQTGGEDGGQDVDDAGSCACTTDHRAPTGLGALLGLLVLGLRRRSRR